MYPFERMGSLSGPGWSADDTTIVPANAIASQTTGHQRDDSGRPVGNRIRNSAMPAGQNTQSIQDCTQATGSTAGSEPGAVKMPRSAYCSARNSRQKSRLRVQKIQPSGCSGRRDAIKAPTTAKSGISRMTILARVIAEDRRIADPKSSTTDAGNDGQAKEPPGKPGSGPCAWSPEHAPILSHIRDSVEGEVTRPAGGLAPLFSGRLQGYPMRLPEQSRSRACPLPASSRPEARRPTPRCGPACSACPSR